MLHAVWRLLLQVGDVIHGVGLTGQAALVIWSAVGGVQLYRMLKNGKGEQNGKEIIAIRDLNESVVGLREDVAAIGTKTDTNTSEIGILREEIGKVPRMISEAMSRVASDATARLGTLEDNHDRRLGDIDRRVEELVKRTGSGRRGKDRRER